MIDKIFESSIVSFHFYNSIGDNKTKRKKEGEKLSKMYTCEEVAERYGVQIITIWDWIRKKKLPAIKIGKEYRISEDDIKAFEDSRRTVKI